MGMENVSFLQVIKFLLSQNSLNLLWGRTRTWRTLRRPEESIVWSQVNTIYIHMAVMEVHGDKSDIAHLALVSLSYCNIVFGVDCRRHWRRCKYNLLSTLRFGQGGYQGLTEHLNLPRNSHEAEETGKTWEELLLAVVLGLRVGNSLWGSTHLIFQPCPQGTILP